MHGEWYDVVGAVGVVLIVVSYFLLQAGRLDGRDRRYALLNALGAVLILISLVYRFNLSAFLVELFWLLISLYGLARRPTRVSNDEERASPSVLG